jgi:glycosyltransferase involved in cell wall biosynthesis
MKIIVVKNIPSPYRNKLFNSMNIAFLKCNIDLEVWYMAKREKNRLWHLPEESFQYKHRYFKGIHHKGLHLNFGLIIKLLFSKYDYVILGGAFVPTNIICSFLIPMRKKILWTEGNIDSSQKKNSLAVGVKKFLTNRYHHYIVPGQRGINYINWLTPENKTKTLAVLPNLIDEKRYVYDVTQIRSNKNALRLKYELSPEQKVIFIPARLEFMKNLEWFVQCFYNLKKFTIVIAGEGVLRDKIRSAAVAAGVDLRLIGHKSQEEILELYACSDIFALPSIWDSSPLSVIEAIAAGLPIIVSNRIGNYEDVLQEGVNGWGIDPYDSVDNVNKLLKSIAVMTAEQLNEMGEKSQQRYNEVFDTEKNIQSFSNHLLSLGNAIG